VAASPYPPPSASHPPVPAIELRGVSLSFEEKLVLENISLQIAPGETAVLLGATGSGKSVLLKLMLGLLKPDAGQILIEGEDIVPLAEAELNPFRSRMGIVFQEGALFDSLSVYENVSYRLWEEGERDETKMEQRVRQVLGFVEMEEAIDKMPSELSGGMQRRVAIARAIISEPSIMLYDSPTAGLDPVTAHTINALIAKLRDVQGATSIVVTARVHDALLLSSFVFDAQKQGLMLATTHGDEQPKPVEFFVLKDGTVLFRGRREELARTRDPYLRRFLG
jgi:phospholipid/cholesterol/gamma-HCH transport system ATP-binding protein